MNREEKKQWLKERNNWIAFKLECQDFACEKCAITEGCDTGNQDLIGEVWAETHGYIKKEIDQPEAKIEKTLADGKIGVVKVSPDIAEKIKKTFIDCEAEALTEANDDPINPSHYKAGKLQTIEQMMLDFGPEDVASFCKCNAFKYHARAGLKGSALEDHQKADWYMRLYDRLKGFGCMAGEQALEALREFLKEEEEKSDR